MTTSRDIAFGFKPQMSGDGQSPPRRGSAIDLQRRPHKEGEDCECDRSGDEPGPEYESR
jgi:hypothetical protein